MKKINLLLPILTFLLLLSFNSAAHDLKGAIDSDDRTPKNILRDKYRNPYETITFFGIESNMTVVELSPGGGWYTEIFANYLHEPGNLFCRCNEEKWLHFDSNSDREI